jgi:rare lipoprotein A
MCDSRIGCDTRLLLFFAFALIVLSAGCGARRLPTGPPPGQGAWGEGQEQASVAPERRQGPFRMKESRPYTVLGKTYYPLATAKGYDERGVASWYGEDFHGKPTATGETYDMNGLSAAHKTLPLNCKVEVTNLENGRSIVIPVNDRGPFVGDRIIDLSYGAAVALGSARSGLAQVRVRAVEEAPGGGREGDFPAGPYYIQVGVFAESPNANRVYQNLVRQGYSGSRITRTVRGGQEMLVVHAGEFSAKSQALQALMELKRDFPSSFIGVFDNQ